MELADPLFEDGFGSFLTSGSFSDVILRTKDGDYPAHRLLLSHCSEYFAEELQKNHSGVIEVEGNSGTHLPRVLEWMYRGTLPWTAELAVDMVEVGWELRIAKLQEEAGQWLVPLPHWLALRTLRVARRVGGNSLAGAAVVTAGKHFQQLADPLPPPPPHWSGWAEWAALTAREVGEVVRADHLASAGEAPVLRLLLRYCEAHPGEPEAVALFRHVRFPFLPPDLRQWARQFPIIPKELLDEAEGPPPPPTATDPLLLARWRPREAYAVSLEWRGESHVTFGGESGGVFAHVGSAGGTREWRNPGESGEVEVSASSVEKGSVGTLLGGGPREFWTKDVPASWVQVSLGPARSLRPTGYSLRHGGHSRADLLRTWTLQGSQDGSQWEVLRRHVMDASLNAPFAAASWALEGEASYRFFRILQTGHNSSSNNFLSLSGFELYGDLYEENV